MAMATSGAVPVARSEPRTHTALVLEAIALRHQIAVLERNRGCRPCFRRSDRLLWVLLSHWWPEWRESPMIVQPQTVLRWRRRGWYALWRCRSRGRWRGGRPRVSSEVRHLIARMAGENFLWGSPRIRGELMKLGFTVSQATVSRYMPASNRRPRQSWRTFIRNQTIAFSHHQNPEEHSDIEHLGLQVWSYWVRLTRSVAQIARVSAGLSRWHAHQPPAPNAPRIALRSGQRERGPMHRVHRVAAVRGGARKARSNRLPAAVPIRSPPFQARASPWL
jgi:hypothetical protein